MINHFRTLLLNQPSKETDSELYVYIAPAFVPVTLNEPLQAVWDVLYGKNLSDDDLHCRASQLMSLLHSTPLEKYVMQMDPRVTYWPMTKKLVEHKLPDSVTPLSQLVTKLEPIFTANKALFFPEYLDPYVAKHCESHQYIYRLGGALIAYVNAVEDCR